MNWISRFRLDFLFYFLVVQLYGRFHGVCVNQLTSVDCVRSCSMFQQKFSLLWLVELCPILLDRIMNLWLDSQLDSFYKWKNIWFNLMWRVDAVAKTEPIFWDSGMQLARSVCRKVRRWFHSREIKWNLQRVLRKRLIGANSSWRHMASTWTILCLKYLHCIKGAW